MSAWAAQTAEEWVSKQERRLKQQERRPAPTRDTGWVAFTPAVGAITIGNGNVYGRYRKQGKTGEALMRFTLGTTSAVGTAPGFGLPFVASNPGDPILAHVEMLDVGAYYFQGQGLLVGPTYVQMNYLAAGPGGATVLMQMNNAAPAVFVAGDSITLRIICEIND